MKRDIDIEQVSDGKRYTSNDMVRLGCDDCSGCSDCCRGMGSSILFDPYDAYRLMKGLGCSFDALLVGDTEVSEVPGDRTGSGRRADPAAFTDDRRNGKLFFFERGGTVRDP